MNTLSEPPSRLSPRPPLPLFQLKPYRIAPANLVPVHRPHIAVPGILKNSKEVL